MKFVPSFRPLKSFRFSSIEENDLTREILSLNPRAHNPLLVKYKVVYRDVYESGVTISFIVYLNHLQYQFIVLESTDWDEEYTTPRVIDSLYKRAHEWIEKINCYKRTVERTAVIKEELLGFVF